MAGLEAVLRIAGQDDSGAAFAGLKAHIDAIDKQASTLSKFVNSIGKVTASVDPMAKSITEAQRALNVQREAILGVVTGLERMEGAGGAVGAMQGRLTGEIEGATRAMVLQGTEAYRVSEKIMAAQKRAGAGGGGHGGKGGLGEAGMFMGPEVLEKTKAAAEAGATVQERIAQLTAAGATPEQIAKARGDYRDFSRTHAGVLESDYLAGYKDARVIAPAESFEMAKHGAVLRSALRNSGLSVAEGDTGDALRIMDELGLKTDAQREDFINQILKTQKTFGSQVPVGTMLAAIRNAKQSVYQMSPDFINKYLPTLLQSSGQNGGTEIMTAYSNYIGQHMEPSELIALANAGFAKNSDLLYSKNGTVKGVKPTAKFFEEDLFERNVAEWSWKMHDQFLSRPGATEQGFDKLIAKMPRNMAAMIAFWTHNEARVKRDADTREGAIGDRAAGNDALARNPVAGLDALKESIESFAAAVTAPGMEKIGAGLSATAQGIQNLSAAVGDFAAKHPQEASDLGIAGLGAGLGYGAYKTWQLFTSGFGKLFGDGGEGVGPAAVKGGSLGRLVAGVLGRGAILDAVVELTEALDPKGDFGGMMAGPDKWIKEHFGFDPSNVPTSWPRSSPSGSSGPPSRLDRGALPYLNNQDLQGIGNEVKVSLDPASKATVIVEVRVSPTDELLRAIASATAHAEGALDVHLGRMEQMRRRSRAAHWGEGEGARMKITIDTSDFKRLSREIDRLRAKMPMAIARGLNEGGDKVRTQVQRALQAQTGLRKYKSVTSRVHTARAFGDQADTSAVVQGSSLDQGMQYQIIVKGKPPTKPEEFRYRVTTGPGGGVTVWMCGRPHKVVRSFEIAGKEGAEGLRMRTLGPHLPIRAFRGPNLAKEAVKDQAAEAFYRGAAVYVMPAVEKQIMKLLKYGALPGAK